MAKCTLLMQHYPQMTVSRFHSLLFRGPHRDAHDHGSLSPLHQDSVHPPVLGGGRPAPSLSPAVEGPSGHTALPTSEAPATRGSCLTVPSRLPPSAQRASVRLLLSDQYEKFEINIPRTVPTGDTLSDSGHQCPPACANASHT